MLAKNKEYDLAIVGAGLSGSVAAVQAGLLGIKTLLVEKGRTLGGTGNYVEGVFAVGSKLQKERGVDINPQKIIEEEREWTHALADMKIWQNYINESAKNIEWLQKYGARISEMRTLGTGDDTWHLFEGHGKQAINHGLLPVAKKHGVEIITSSRVIKLETNSQGIVNGVLLKDFESDTEQSIVTKNVILATGGYLNNPELLDSNNNHNSNRIIPVNSGKDTGDGLNLAWNVGAKKFGMGTVMMFGGQLYEPKVAGYKNWQRAINRAVTHEAILWVNQNGERFANEDCTDIWAIAGNTLIRQEKVYAILDQTQFKSLAKHAFKGNYDYKNLLAELDSDIKSNKPYLFKANTVKELAKKMQLDNLEITVKHYNDLVKQGRDTDFYKKANYLHKISNGPVYAFELGVGAFCTLGGLKVNFENKVLDNNGHPIGGLYAIGSDGSAVLVGDTYGVNVPGSEAGYCVYSGRNAVFNLIK
ncbi:fumarate reductase flavoprotein subunit [Lactobacillus colini]|uniref:Fumarate reductase flavoprotein subunit n=1 Tax=Lactobacillus colini TaxID=1819254 RepID=A0ABS4MB21_9LACO|nr:FAD-binding protein [Lactobacillus colini]MBP2056876.1 fumarate reductase flavoprotein subunit [Lactobacillus colini]